MSPGCQRAGLHKGGKVWSEAERLQADGQDGKQRSRNTPCCHSCFQPEFDYAATNTSRAAPEPASANLTHKFYTLLSGTIIWDHHHCKKQFLRPNIIPWVWTDPLREAPSDNRETALVLGSLHYWFSRGFSFWLFICWFQQQICQASWTRADAVERHSQGRWKPLTIINYVRTVAPTLLAHAVSLLKLN